MPICVFILCLYTYTTILAIFIFFLDVYGFTAVKMTRSFINDVVFRVSFIASSPSRLMPNASKAITNHLNLKEERSQKLRRLRSLIRKKK